MLSLSLLLHLAIIAFVRVGAIESGGMPPRPILQARLVLAANDKAQPVLLKALDKIPPTHIADFKPLPEVAATPQPSAQAEKLNPGMPKEAATPTQIDAPIPAAPTYYGLKDVDEHPRQLGNPMYPDLAAEQNISGSVRVRLLLNENGGVDEAEVLEEKPPGYGFKETVLRYLKTAHFKPAIRKGQAVKSTVNFELEFRVQDEVPP